MSVPFHRLRVCGNILLAARGAAVHTFNIVDGTHLAQWQVPMAEEEENKDEKVVEKTTENGSVPPEEAGDEDAPPSKRRRVETGEQEEQKGTAETAETTDQQIQENGQKKKKSKSKKNANQTPKDPAKAQASALRTADLPVVSILETTADGRHVVVIMGHDKTVRVLSHDNGHLVQLSERVVPKRPCAVAFTADGKTILSGDKFGDVYALPLLETEKTEAAGDGDDAKDRDAPGPAPPVPAAPAAPLRLEANQFTVHTKGNRQALENQRRQKELLAAQQKQKDAQHKEERADYQLLLGHVSMLTAVLVAEGVPKTQTLAAAGQHGPAQRRPLIITADRDEHIRVTRGAVAQTHVIETFCLGHTSFVSRLCIPHDRRDRLVSGGGDGELWVWDFWPDGRLVGKAELASLVAAVVGDEGPKVALSGLYAFGGQAHADANAMTDGDDAFIVAICERVPALFFFRMADDGSTLVHTQTLPLPEGQLPLDVVEVGAALYVAAVAAQDTGADAAEAPSTLLAATRSGPSGEWTAALSSVSLPPPAAYDAATAALDRAALRKLLLHSTESLRKDNEGEE